MLQLFPFVTLLAAATSLVMMVMLFASGGLGLRAGTAAVTAFLVGVYCQFLSASPLVAAAGLGLQTLLAIVLIVKWRLSV